MSKSMKCLWYEDKFFIEFLNSIVCWEYLTNPRVFTKAVRNTLIALGYERDYINGEFCERMEQYLDSCSRDNFELLEVNSNED